MSEMSEAKFLAPNVPKKPLLVDATLVSDRDKGGVRDKVWAAAVARSREGMRSLDPFSADGAVDNVPSELELTPIQRDTLDGKLKESLGNMPDWDDKPNGITLARKNIDPVDLKGIDPKFNKPSKLDVTLAKKGDQFTNLEPIQFDVEPNTSKGRGKVFDLIQDAMANPTILDPTKHANTPRLSVDEQDQLARAERLLQNNPEAMKSKKQEIKGMIATLRQDASLDQVVKSQAAALAELRVRYQDEKDPVKKEELDNSLKAAQDRLDATIKQFDANLADAQARIAKKKKEFFEEFGIEFDSVVK